MQLAYFYVGIAVIVGLLSRGIWNKDRRLRRAPKGSTRAELVKARMVDKTVRQYVDAGWSIVDKNADKSSFLYDQVRITFRKE